MRLTKGTPPQGLDLRLPDRDCSADPYASLLAVRPVGDDGATALQEVVVTRDPPVPRGKLAFCEHLEEAKTVQSIGKRHTRESCIWVSKDVSNRRIPIFFFGALANQPISHRPLWRANLLGHTPAHASAALQGSDPRPAVHIFQWVEHGRYFYRCQVYASNVGWSLHAPPTWRVELEPAYLQHGLQIPAVVAGRPAHLCGCRVGCLLPGQAHVGALFVCLPRSGRHIDDHMRWMVQGTRHCLLVFI